MIEIRLGSVGHELSLYNRDGQIRKANGISLIGSEHLEASDRKRSGVCFSKNERQHKRCDGQVCDLHVAIV